MVNKSNFTIFFLYFYTFLYLFNPGNFFSFNLLYILFGFSLIYFVLNKGFFIKIISYKRVLVLISTCLIFIFYMLISHLFGGSDALIRGYSFFVLLMNLCCAITILGIYFKIYSLNLDDFLSFLIKIIFIQLLFVLLAVCVPAFRDWVLMTARQDDIFRISNDAGSGLRSFGFSNGYTSTFPMLLGLFGLIVFKFFLIRPKVREKIYYFITFCFLIFSIVLNARSGLIPIFLLLFFLPLDLLKIKNIKSSLILIFCFLILFFLAFPFIKINEDYLFRLMQGFDELNDLSQGSKTGTFATLSDMFFFPQSVSGVLFGEGHRIFGANNRGSDLGLIQDIFMFGLLPLTILLIMLIYIFFPVFRMFYYKYGFIFTLIFILSLILYYVKGVNFYANEVQSLMFILLIFSLLYGSVKKTNSNFG